VQFQVVNRSLLATPFDLIPPGAQETGRLDTVIAYPEQITRIKVRFKTPGLFVWHCHMLEHEDNEMMRPYHIGPKPPDLPVS
jgi:FtsP/CotA-like multicopper oxidase with cupredoxin domain